MGPASSSRTSPGCSSPTSMLAPGRGCRPCVRAAATSPAGRTFRSHGSSHRPTAGAGHDGRCVAQQRDVDLTLLAGVDRLHWVHVRAWVLTHVGCELGRVLHDRQHPGLPLGGCVGVGVVVVVDDRRDRRAHGTIRRGASGCRASRATRLHPQVVGIPERGTPRPRTARSPDESTSRGNDHGRHG